MSTYVIALFLGVAFGFSLNKAGLTKYHKILCTGPTDSNMSRAGGGVGIVYDAHYTVILLDPLTPEFKKITQKAEPLHSALITGMEMPLMLTFCMGNLGGTSANTKPL